MSVAILASLACVNWKSASAWPNILRDVERDKASCSAQRANPSAAAATEDRKMSSVDMAILKPWPGSPQELRRRNPAVFEDQACQRMRRHDFNAFRNLQARCIGVDDEGGNSLAPAASPVRANKR